MQVSNISNEEKNWSWDYTVADKVRSGYDVEILTKEYHVLLVKTEGHIIVLRAKEHGKQEVEEIKVFPTTILRYKKEDAKNGDWMSMFLGGDDGFK